MEGLPPGEARFFSKLDELWQKTPKSLKVVIFILKWLLIGTIFYFSIYGFIKKYDIDINKLQESPLGDSVAETSFDTDDCNVLGINLHGALLTYVPSDSMSDLFDDTDVVSSEGILYYIDQAERDENIKAILG